MLPLEPDALAVSKKVYIGHAVVLRNMEDVVLRESHKALNASRKELENEIKALGEWNLQKAVKALDTTEMRVEQ